MEGSIINAPLAAPPFIPESANAPFSKEQIAWLNGFLAGMYSGQGSLPAAGTNGCHDVAVKPLTILWGSQTGNSEALARQASKALTGGGFEASVYDMGEYDKEKLASEENVVIITSTYGDGEPPDNAAVLYEWLMSESAPRLEKLRYSVVALGDSNYPDFCKCGIDLDNRLQSLGARPVVPRVECDVEFEEPFDAWLKTFQEAAGDSAAPELENGLGEVGEREPAYGKKNPFSAPVLRNEALNRLGSAKETRHIELSLAGSGLHYAPGDALAVVPENDPIYIADLLAAAGFSGEEEATLPDGDVAPLKEALAVGYDVTSLTVKTLKTYAALTGNPKLKALADDKESFKVYAWGRQIVDMLLEHPHRFGSVEEFLGLFGKLGPRLYSISSSPKAHPDAVHVTVGVVRYEAHGRLRAGVCSSYLARRDEAAPVRIYFHPTKSFRLPESEETPVIMVGPGTGIAPFRAFLEERAATGATGENWLFFGDQKERCDFLYRDELEAFRQQGVLTRLDTAFSRDQERKVYVQDRMLENGEELYRWLERGACFYVCGDASRMAKDVDAALRRVVQEHGGLAEPEANAYVERMKKDKRYLRDVY